MSLWLVISSLFTLEVLHVSRRQTLTLGLTFNFKVTLTLGCYILYFRVLHISVALTLTFNFRVLHISVALI